MRYVSGIAPPVAPVAGDQVKPVAGIRPVKPVAAHGNKRGIAGQHQEHQSKVSSEQGEAGRGASSQAERRQVARRLLHQPVLLELRSGIERRHHNLREGDIVEHIDVEV